MSVWEHIPICSRNEKAQQVESTHTFQSRASLALKRGLFTTFDKNMKKKIIITAAAAIVLLIIAAVISSSHKVSHIVSQAEIGMSKAEILQKCGQPTNSGQVGSPQAIGAYIEYAFPYWWDYALWRIKGGNLVTVEGRPHIPGAPKCTIEFQEKTGELVAVTISTTAAYSDISPIVKGEPILDKSTET